VKKTGVALLAENDQLRMAIADALSRLDGGALSVKCVSCGARPRLSCCDDDPLPFPHAARVKQATDALRQVLVDALKESGPIRQ
jgi:hypothetical protein